MTGKYIPNLAFAVLISAAISSMPTAATIQPKIDDYDKLSQYSFAYYVQDTSSGDSKVHHERRIGNLVRGSYSFIEADGTRRIVDYTADPINGFNAIVNRELPRAITPRVSIVPIGIYSMSIIPEKRLSRPELGIPVSGPDADVEILDTGYDLIRKTYAKKFIEQPVEKRNLFGKQLPDTNEKIEKLRTKSSKASFSHLDDASIKIESITTSPSVDTVPIDAAASVFTSTPTDTDHYLSIIYKSAYSSPHNTPPAVFSYTPVKF